MPDSQSLLTEYVQTGSNDAFGELVVRYINLVHSTALRLVAGDAHQAEDVTQMVFADLARLATNLPGDVMLGGWLHRDTCFVAANLMRGERRRQSRERQAAEMNTLQRTSGADFSLIAPLLDEAINELGEADRTAILLRFFEQHDFRAVGQALGSNEDAARMRVSRALEKLQDFLKSRGVTTGAASLAAALSANAVQAAPVGLALTISSAAAVAGTKIITATKTIAMTTFQKAFIGTALTAAVATGVYETRQAHLSAVHVQALEQQQAPLTEQIQQLTRERNDATNRLAISDGEISKAKSNFDELMKLRSEVGQLRGQIESRKLQAGQKPDSQRVMPGTVSHAPGIYIAKDQMGYAGYDTPEAAFETINWAMLKGTYEQATEGLSPKLSAEELSDPKGREQFETRRNKLEPLFKGIKVMAKKTVSDDKVELKVELDVDAAMSQLNPNWSKFSIQPMVKIGTQWKLGGSTRSFKESWGSDGQIEVFVP